jgi:KaiC/GvpD/RAD55 family RecA-like ATPase
VDAFTSGVGESAKRERFLDIIRQAITDLNAQRVVIDSVSTFTWLSLCWHGQH